MFDFTITDDAPVPVKINGTEYKVPQVRLMELSEWATHTREQHRNEATAHIADSVEKARVLMYFPPLGIDVVQLVQDAVTPEGVVYFVRRQFKLAKVPDQIVEGVLRSGNPLALRKLVDKLVKTDEIVQDQGDKPDEEGKAPDPLSGQSSTSNAA